jgi:hypothetical protein
MLNANRPFYLNTIYNFHGSHESATTNLPLMFALSLANFVNDSTTSSDLLPQKIITQKLENPNDGDSGG